MLPKHAKPMESRADVLKRERRDFWLSSLLRHWLNGWLQRTWFGWLMAEAFLSSGESTTQRNLWKIVTWTLKNMSARPAFLCSPKNQMRFKNERTRRGDFLLLMFRADLVSITACKLWQPPGWLRLTGWFVTEQLWHLMFLRMAPALQMRLSC